MPPWHRGRWQGPEQLWLGDLARTIITEAVDGVPDTWVLYLDDTLKVVEVNVSVDDEGAEDVGLALGRPLLSTTRDARAVNALQLARLERH